MSLPTVSDLNTAQPNPASAAPAPLANLPAIPTGIQEYETVLMENVGVRYKIANQRIATFKEYMIRRIQGKVQNRDFWALRGLNLSIHRGETFGFIGHNGAGKSTLLKLVARVLKPTEGRVVVRGRVAPLLEIGAGFHNELTGRENVYLNGALLGFSSKEMDQKFDRIVDFAELWDFIDAPMRTYSTGMWARLGFAVATDSQPDVLIVDEVMAVGDQAFLHKSYNRIMEFRDNGATILIVSHSMQLVEQLCHRVAWIDHGNLRCLDEASKIIPEYLEHFK
jgi:ABC-2 type transport system ATP-binding protein